MTHPTSSTYDAVLYPSYAHPQTHPDRLAAVAVLFGVEGAAMPERCRVLELGCGDGTNLIGIASDLPDARLVGIDLAAVPVRLGQERARRFGLSNLTLRQMDVTDARSAAAELGEFDYVIAHGLYSWVPEPVREAVLALCAQVLAPQGVAYVSYNTLPGGYFRRMAREMMRYHVGRMGPGAGPADQLRGARGLLQFLAEAQASFVPEWEQPGATAAAVPKDPWARVDDYSLAVRRYHERVAEKLDEVLFHDELSDHNDCFYVSEFAERANRHGLRFLAEADLSETRNHGLAPRVREVVARLAGNDPLAVEQYADFVRGRSFRQSLLCRPHVTPRLWPDVARLAGLYAASPATPAPGGPAVGGLTGPTVFGGVKGTTLATTSRVSQAVMLTLGAAWPRPLGLGEIVAAVRERLGPGAAADAGSEQAVALAVLAGSEAAVVQLRARRPAVATAPSDRPVASPLVRRQAEGGTQVINLLGEPATIEPVVIRRLLTLMDGSRDRAALIRDLAPMFPPNQPPTPAWLDDALARLARLALLTA